MKDIFRCCLDVRQLVVIVPVMVRELELKTILDSREQGGLETSKEAIGLFPLG